MPPEQYANPTAMYYSSFALYGRARVREREFAVQVGGCPGAIKIIQSHCDRVTLLLLSWFSYRVVVVAGKNKIVLNSAPAATSSPANGRHAPVRTQTMKLMEDNRQGESLTGDAIYLITTLLVENRK